MADAPPRRLRRTVLLAVAAVVLALGGYAGWRHLTYARARAAALDAIGRREFAAASASLAVCRGLSPGDPDLAFLAARTARRAGDLDDADALLDEAERLGAGPSAVKRERLLLLAQKGHFRDLESILSQMLAETRDEYDLVAEVVTAVHLRNHRFAEARGLLNRWIDLRPDDPEPRLRRAFAAERQVDFAAAADDYRFVLDRQPERTPVRARLAEVLLKVRKPAEALAAAKARPEGGALPAELSLVTSRCHRELGDLAAAREALAAIPAGERDSPPAVLERGLLALAAGEAAEAEGLLRRARENTPREREVIYSLQAALARQGKKDEAEALAVVLREIDADGQRLSRLLHRHSRDPRDAELCYEIGTIFMRNRATEEGRRWMRLALEAKPGHEGARRALAEK